jgi:hypothetical protein
MSFIWTGEKVTEITFKSFNLIKSLKRSAIGLILSQGDDNVQATLRQRRANF